jgi:hypothetical protein
MRNNKGETDFQGRGNQVCYLVSIHFNMNIKYPNTDIKEEVGYIGLEIYGQD